ncbi:MAG: hypothetical protein J0L55_01620 [Caulobacterales bacterium]|nr:hypothetical protein [Caulobacterales bacterium]MCA0373989.1 hypothetical protein [Pseudomonadota bacterium]
MDNKNKTEALNVKASDIHGPSVSLRVLFLFGAFCFVMGFFIGGITLPYLRFKPPIEDLKNQDKNPTHDGALTTIGPQTLWAAPMEGIAPISTNLSVEQVIDEYRNLGERNGYETNIEYANVGEGFEARFAFTPIDKERLKRTYAPAPNKDFYKSLVLNFTRGKETGSAILSSMRKDGHEISKGAAFVDLISFGTQMPELAPNQFLTPKGIFEIRSNENGSIATIDGKQVFPIPSKPALDIIKNEKPSNDEANEGAPQILRLLGVQSSQPNFKERFILVSGQTNGAPCTAKAIIIDVPHDKVTIVPNTLKSLNMNIGNAPKSFTISGFCETAPKAKSGDNLQTVAAYNFLTGELTINHVAQIAPQPVQTSITNIAGVWRQTSPTRIASPYGAGGALASLTCRPSGGVSIGVSGLPAPADGKAAKIIFDSSTGSATADLAFSASSNTYEINSAQRPLETKQILGVMRANGNLMMTGAGGKKVIIAPGNSQIDAMIKNCNPIIAKPTAPQIPAQ